MQCNKIVDQFSLAGIVTGWYKICIVNCPNGPFSGSRNLIIVQPHFYHSYNCSYVYPHDLAYNYCLPFGLKLETYCIILHGQALFSIKAATDNWVKVTFFIFAVYGVAAYCLLIQLLSPSVVAASVLSQESVILYQSVKTAIPGIGRIKKVGEGAKNNFSAHALFFKYIPNMTCMTSPPQKITSINIISQQPDIGPLVFQSLQLASYPVSVETGYEANSSHS